MIKKKRLIIFLVLVSFLCSSIIVFFYSQKNEQPSSVVTENKDEKETKENKPEEKNNADQKEENGDNQEEVEDLPFLLRWQGATLALVVSGIIAAFLVVLLKKNDPCSCISSDEGRALVEFLFLFVILFFVLSPFLLAIKGYKDKSYKERYRLLWRDYWKPPLCVALSWVLLFVVLYIISQ